MRKLILTAAYCCFLQFSFAETMFTSAPTPQTFLIIQPELEAANSKSLQKKKSLKVWHLLKWYKKNMQRASSEEKKNVKKLGLFSIVAALIGSLAITLAFTTSWLGIFLPVGIVFCLAAIILGLISLKRRKKLTDKTGTSKIHALIGIILGSISILLPLIFLILFSLYYE